MAQPLLLLLVVLLAPLSTSAQQPCASRTFPNNRIFSSCNALPHLSSSLHFTFSNATSTLALAFVSTPPDPAGWVAWAINPSGPKMSGAQALAAYRKPGKGLVAATYNVSGDGPYVPSKIAYGVEGLEAAEGGGGEVVIYATVKLPAGTKKVSHVWQVGAKVDGASLGMHETKPDNLQSTGTLDLLKGFSAGETSGSAKIRNRNIHGVLNAVSWGVLLPIGAIIARYLKTFRSADPAWFYLHVSCQVAGYAVGVGGWGTGLKLGSLSKDVEFSTHRCIGIALFCIGTLQVLALLLRPNKQHKYRKLWNAYHHGAGYTVIILGVINVFEGMQILQPEEFWKTAYIVVICALGGVAMFLEVFTWVVVLRRRKSETTDRPYDGAGNDNWKRQPPNA